jgi:hypothetical protein
LIDWRIVTLLRFYGRDNAAENCDRKAERARCAWYMARNKTRGMTKQRAKKKEEKKKKEEQIEAIEGIGGQEANLGWRLEMRRDERRHGTDCQADIACSLEAEARTRAVKSLLMRLFASRDGTSIWTGALITISPDKERNSRRIENGNEWIESGRNRGTGKTRERKESRSLFVVAPSSRLYDTQHPLAWSGPGVAPISTLSLSILLPRETQWHSTGMDGSHCRDSSTAVWILGMLPDLISGGSGEPEAARPSANQINR